MATLNLHLEDKESAKAERKRQMEEERKQRIFAPKSKLLGLDPTGVAQQLQEKSAAAQRKEEEERQYGAQICRLLNTLY